CIVIIVLFVWALRLFNFIGNIETEVLHSRRWSNEPITHIKLTQPECGRKKPAPHV
ncbi:hypothetical protein WDU94_010586, partial [Cyamophila willieti]